MQAFSRGRTAAARTRESLQQSFDQLLATRLPSNQILLAATRQLALITQSTRNIDNKRLAIWCRCVLSPTQNVQGRCFVLHWLLLEQICGKIRSNLTKLF